MVKKLYKHEFIAWLRVLPLVWLITLAVSGIHRLVQLLETDTVYYDILNASGLIVFFVAIFACLLFPVIFGIVRFYRNFFTGEGYLTFTLPVTQKAHLWVKVSTAVCFSIVSGLVCLLSGMLITAGEVFSEVIKAVQYLLRQLPGDLYSQLPWYILEYLALLLVGQFYGYLMYGTCICVGQQFRKNRILAAVGVYFGIYIISQVVSTVCSVAFMILSETGALQPLYTFIETQTATAIHIGLCALIVLSGLLALVFWLISHSILRRRLNLE